MSIVRQTCKQICNGLLPSSFWLARGPRHASGVALTFDDGPHPEQTPRLLDALGEHGVKATFFVVGKEAERHPELISRIEREGHLLGHHSWTHSEPATTSTAQLQAEVQRSQSLLRGLTGRQVDWFRPPKGQLTAGKLFALWKLRQTVVLWNVDPKDYQSHSAQPLERWCDRYAPRAGDLLLFHDRFPFAADILPQLVKRVTDLGLSWQTPADWKSPEPKKQTRPLNQAQPVTTSVTNEIFGTSDTPSCRSNAVV